MNLDKVRLYYLSYNLYAFSSGLTSIFMSLFILATASLVGVIYFNMFYYAGLEIALFACAYTLEFVTPKDLYIAGTIFRAVTLVAILFSAMIVSNPLLFGFIYGISIGTFFLGNNILLSDVSRGVDRKDFVYKNSLIGSIVALFAPTIAGVLIEYSQFSGSLRFTYDFLAAFVMLVASAYFLWIANIKRPPRPIVFSIKDVVIRQKDYQDYKRYFLVYQLFYIPFSILLPVFVFQMTNSYTIAGIYGSLILFITVFANYLVYIKNRYWRHYVKIFIAVTIASSLLLLVPQLVSPLFAIFLFTAIYTLTSTPLNNQVTSNFLELIDKSAKDRIHFWLNREVYLTLGRAIIFLVLAIALMEMKGSIYYFIYALPPLSLYSLIYLRVSQREDDKTANKAVVTPLLK